MKDLRPILLVEDNPMDLDLTLRALNHRNVANPIEVARDGEEALAWLARWEQGENQPVAVLLDLKLPRVSGLEVLRQIRNSVSARLTPVVVLTSSAEDIDVKTAYELGANSYIVKPVTFESFVEVATQVQLYWCVLNKPSR